MTNTIIYTDGSCLGNPGRGGWAAIIIKDTIKRSMYGCNLQTTNNQMELIATIEALKSIEESEEIELFTDSEYVKKGIEVWVTAWLRNNWRTVSGQPVKNRDLWQQLLVEQKHHKITWHHVKGHAGHPLNEEVDKLAQNVARNQDATHSKMQIDKNIDQSGFVNTNKDSVISVSQETSLLLNGVISTENNDIAIRDLAKLFNPSDITIVGVSKNQNKVGTIILKNIQAGGFKGGIVSVNPSYAGSVLYDIRCYGKIEKVTDLCIIATPATTVEDIINDCLAVAIKNILIISSNVKINPNLKRILSANKVNVIGSNCVGYLSTHGNLNAHFGSTVTDIHGDASIISQSGIFCSIIAKQSHDRKFGIAKAISLGNRLDLSEIELINYLVADPQTRIIFLQLESTRDRVAMEKAIENAIGTKTIAILKPILADINTQLSHGDGEPITENYTNELSRKYKIPQIDNVEGMVNVIEALYHFGISNWDSKILIVSNSSAIGSSAEKLCKQLGIVLTKPTESFIQSIKQKTNVICMQRNPLDIGGDANNERYMAIIEEAIKYEYNEILLITTPQGTINTEKLLKNVGKLRENATIHIMSCTIGEYYQQPMTYSSLKSALSCIANVQKISRLTYSKY